MVCLFFFFFILVQFSLDVEDNLLIDLYYSVQFV
ncbi:hypothetical protein GLYMA_10G079950v4 [Glycine max]|nr:hypothetical protein GLYMA_10G079950v4 [Glycine max]KAH1137288.1 hypothetical protein GYH30_027323 [Glycine max]